MRPIILSDYRIYQLVDLLEEFGLWRTAREIKRQAPDLFKDDRGTSK